jgi:hypothetical protein
VSDDRLRLAARAADEADRTVRMRTVRASRRPPARQRTRAAGRCDGGNCAVRVTCQSAEDRRLNLNLTVGVNTIQPASVTRDPGVLLDLQLSMKQHIAKLSTVCFFRLLLSSSFVCFFRLLLSSASFVFFRLLLSSASFVCFFRLLLSSASFVFFRLLLSTATVAPTSSTNWPRRHGAARPRSDYNLTGLL